MAPVTKAAILLPVIRTQSGTSRSHAGPIPLEVNLGGGLNLTQLPFGAGVLDEVCGEHPRICGCRI